MSDPIFTENGSVQVRLSTGVEITFVPTTPGFYSIHINDPRGAHYSLPGVTVEDFSVTREAMAYAMAGGRLEPLRGLGEAA